MARDYIFQCRTVRNRLGNPVSKVLFAPSVSDAESMLRQVARECGLPDDLGAWEHGTRDELAVCEESRSLSLAREIGKTKSRHAGIDWDQLVPVS